MHWMDLSLLVGFFGWILLAGLRHRTRSARENHFGNGSASWWQMALSVVATESSALTFIAIPAMSFATDNSFWNVYFAALIARPLIALFFLGPFYAILRNEPEGLTPYGFIGRRLGPLHGDLATVSFFLMRFLASGVRLYVAALLVQQITGFPLAANLVLFLSVALLYSYSGGINAVIRTDLVQFLFLIGSALGIYFWFASQGAFTAEFPPEKLASLNWNFSLKESFTLPAALLSIAIFDIATHAADFDLFQRLLAGKSVRQAKVAVVTSAFLSIFMGGLFLAIGIAFYGYVQVQNPTGLPEGAENAYAFVLANLLPAGLLGMVVAGLLAASLSSLDSALTAFETVWARDFQTRFPRLSLSRLQIFFLCALGFFLVALWAQTSPNVLVLGLKVQSYLVVPLLGLLASAVFGWHSAPRLHLAAFFAATGVQLALVLNDVIGWAWGPLFSITSYFLVYGIGRAALGKRAAT